MRQKDRHHFRTEFIKLNTRICRACWECVENCPKEVFGRIDFLGHRHAKMKNPDKCTGCFICTKVCKFDAITQCHL